MLVVIAFVFLHLATAQVVAAEEIQCPSVCICPNRTVAICKDVKIIGIDVDRGYKFEEGLEKLDFSGNKLTVLNDNIFAAWNVYNLRFFNLSGNKIVNITRFAFVGFSELVELDLSRNNLFSINSEAFALTTNLTMLYLGRNKLTEISPIIFDSLNHLRHLDLSNNDISTIKPETVRNNCDLEWLSLSSNKLTEIHPDSFSRLYHLRQLDLSNNSVSSIQPGTFLSSGDLECLSLAKNSLTVLCPGTFQNQSNLLYLDLSGNLIPKIAAESFYYNRKLGTLLLASNMISEFSGLAFHEESELSYLDVSGNKIEELDILNCRKLETLNLSRNSLKSLRSRSFSNLSVLLNLSLAGNKISEINDDAFYGLWNLKFLDLSNNSITYLNLSLFRYMFSLSGSNDSDGFCDLKIKYLNLSNNSVRSFNFGECQPTNNASSSSDTFCKLELSYLGKECLSSFYNNSLNLLDIQGLEINLTNKSFAFECSHLHDIYRISDVTLSNPVSAEDLRIVECSSSESNNSSTSVASTRDEGMYVTDGTDESTTAGCVNKTGEMNCGNENKQNLNVFVVGIYASSVFVAVVVVLVITHVVGKPEPDEFWWEDKLAKRNY